MTNTVIVKTVSHSKLMWIQMQSIYHVAKYQKGRHMNCNLVEIIKLLLSIHSVITERQTGQRKNTIHRSTIGKLLKTLQTMTKLNGQYLVSLIDGIYPTLLQWSLEELTPYMVSIVISLWALRNIPQK